MRREQGFVTYVVLGFVLLLGLLFAVGHHSGGSSEEQVAAALSAELREPMGCHGMAECAAAPVPEPASGLLAAAGGIVVGYAVRRKLA